MKRVLHREAFEPLTDEAAIREAQRIMRVASAYWASVAESFGQPDAVHGPVTFTEDCTFVRELLAIFRHARGEDVPSYIVRSAIDHLLTLMFAGLASGVMALPAFDKMSDKPWANAWRISELRLIYTQTEPTDAATFAHLIGIPLATLKKEIAERGFNDTSKVPSILVRSIISQAVNSEQEDEIL